MIIRITKYNVEQITTYPLDHKLRLAIRVISKVCVVPKKSSFLKTLVNRLNTSPCSSGFTVGSSKIAYTDSIPESRR
jgi:hypothetical protein